ncbi:MAG: ubiquinol-cytochrome C chaperone family protein [Litorimonas sp.]
MGLFDRLMGRNLPERRDARRIYLRLMAQARTPELFGRGRIADDFDGRIDMIALHITIMMERLRDEGEDGKLLNQALFDEMKDDFEVALREEGISDTGVKRRIKPMIGHFYDRLKTYTDALKTENPQKNLASSLVVDVETENPSSFALKLADYSLDWLKDLRSLSMKQITSGRFFFPEL